jgi:D-methionine transport system ATP-binding protein
LIQIEKLRKVYRARGREVAAVDGVDLEVREGEIFGVLGRSGAGKSTLLRCVNLLEPPDEGDIYLEGRSICKGPAAPSGEAGWSSTSSGSGSGWCSSSSTSSRIGRRCRT